MWAPTLVAVKQGCQTHFHQGPHQPRGCLQRAEIILGLCKCNYSLTVKELKLHSALWRQLWSWCGPCENEFDTPSVKDVKIDFLPLCPDCQLFGIPPEAMTYPFEHVSIDGCWREIPSTQENEQIWKLLWCYHDLKTKTTLQSHLAPYLNFINLGTLSPLPWRFLRHCPNPIHRPTQAVSGGFSIQMSCLGSFFKFS